MPFLSVEVKPPAQLVQHKLERLRRKVPLISKKRMYDAVVKIRSYMKVPGTKPVYPINWDTKRQRIAFFASNGFGGGIPTKRNNDYVRAWEVIPTERGYDVGNPLSHARYIGGTFRSTKRQSKIHRGRWRLVKVITDKVLGRLPKAVRDSITQTARQEGFRAK